MGYSSSALGAIMLGTGAFINEVPRSFQIDALGLIAPAGKDLEIENYSKLVLILHGTQDSGQEGANNDPRFIFDHANAPSHLVIIEGANHFGYTDCICIEPPFDGTATISQTNQQRITRAYLTAFFRRYLRSDLAMDEYLP